MSSPGKSRENVVEHLRSLYMGPINGAYENTRNRPDRTYLVGTLFPMETAAEPEEELAVDDTDQTVNEVPTTEDDSPEEPVDMANAYRPASSAMSFIHNGTALSITVAYGTYSAVKLNGIQMWQRDDHYFKDIVLEPNDQNWESPDNRAKIVTRWRKLGQNQHLVTVSLQNLFSLSGDDSPILPEQCLYQVSLTADPTDGVVLPYRTVDDLDLGHEEEELALRYRNRRVFAVGHGTSVNWKEDSTACRRVMIDPLPTYAVPTIKALDTKDEILKLSVLAQITENVDGVGQKLTRFVNTYEDWVNSQAAQSQELEARHRNAATRISKRQQIALSRMRAGVSLLVSDSKRGESAREAFRLAMLAMRMQMHQSRLLRNDDVNILTANDVPPDAEPAWRPFQLGFVLLCLESTSDPEHSDRENLVDLIWFPTGGGKTEAYLALAAYEIFRRRLERGSRGGGTAVVTRYTLRLLTTQQFQRAATLICAMERLREEDIAAQGMDPFTIGLWLGNSTTPGNQKVAIEQFELARKQTNPKNPFQLDICPWCGHRIMPRSRTENRSKYGVKISAGDIWLCCPNLRCPFNERLPVEVVDERIYNRPPTFLLATVDKFARLPFVKEAGVLLGAGHTPNDPPSLVIQDEMHLLSGPLGTTVAIYDTAVLGIIERMGGRPKIVASTATIRAADEQVRGLSARHVALFPPSGINEDNSYFAQPDEDKPGRLYIGLMPQAFTQATSVVRSLSAMLEAPQHSVTDEGGLDSYWTVVAYHNSLRELGRTVSLVRDDVNSLLTTRADETGVGRQVSSDALVELTSKVPAEELPQVLERLDLPQSSPDAVDVVASTNMLSVGIDVPRLAAMLMNGQPKTTSEYIQASSRVGRGDVPGIVVTLYRSSRPRDRSHYETFRGYHQALYRGVEPTSVTPWSPASRRRSLAAVFVSMVRHLGPWRNNQDAMSFDPDSPLIKNIRSAILETVTYADPREAEATADDLDELIKQWGIRIRQTHNGTDVLHYEKILNKPHIPALLRSFTDEKREGWPVMNSMRTVDATVSMSIHKEKE